MPLKKPKIIVVGAGLSGSMASIYAANAGVEVTLISSNHPQRSSSSCLREGVSSSVAPYTLEQHISDSIKCSGPIANESRIEKMCEASPRIVNLLERMGVMFDRDVEGYLKIQHGTPHASESVVRVGGRTAQRILAVLNGQLRRYASSERVVMDIGWEFLSPILDDEGRCRGAVAINLKSMEIKPYRADAVIVCSGGYPGIFNNTTRSSVNDGSALISCFKKGAAIANPELVEFYPFTFRAFGKSYPVDSWLLTPEGEVIEDLLTDDAGGVLKLYEESTGLDSIGSPLT
ncbi:MAG: FAD-binding protein, partial [Deltaproteobacteria bacterium]|nr:FAD-binding protein [Deltaproteobacteria bacterium]